MKRFLFSMAAVAVGLTVATATQARGPGGSRGPSGSFYRGGSVGHVSKSNFVNKSNFVHKGQTNQNTLKQSFHRGNPRFHGRSYFKNFTHRWWCNTFGCYYYWCPLARGYFYWYEPFGCYCPIDYIAVAPPVVVVSQPVVTVDYVTTTVTSPVVRTTTPIVHKTVSPLNRGAVAPVPPPDQMTGVTP